MEGRSSTSLETQSWPTTRGLMAPCVPSPRNASDAHPLAASIEARSGSEMATFLDYLGIFLFSCGIVVWCIGAYYGFRLGEGQRREWMEGAGRWGPLNYNIPEPYRTHRRRSIQMAVLFFCILGLMCLSF